jgi:hypothetical protein
MQRTCHSHSCSCPAAAAATLGCRYYGPHSFRIGIPFPDGTYISNTLDLDITGKTYAPDYYMAPEVIQEIRAQRAKHGINSTICISSIVMFITVGIAVAMIG